MRPAYSQQIKAYRRNISIQRNIGGRKNRIVTVGAIKPGSHQPQSQFGITGVMRSTDNAKIEFFILLLFIGVIEVVQELLEKTPFGRSRIKDGDRIRTGRSMYFCQACLCMNSGYSHQQD